MSGPAYQEELISQIPAARLLIALGYHYLTPSQALDLRGGRERNVVLTGVLEEWLKTHNDYTVKGQAYAFTDRPSPKLSILDRHQPQRRPGAPTKGYTWA
jgi:type I restriction enzyme R subunit